MGGTTIGANVGDQRIERRTVARQREHGCAPLGDRDGRRPADAAGGAGDDDVPALQGSVRIVAARAIRIEVLRPIPPELRRVAGELGNAYSSPLQGSSGLLTD